MPQAGRYTAPWLGGGAIQAAKAVTVRNATDSADATVYTSTAGTSTGSNPLTTDSAGLLVTYLAAGRYVLKDAAGDRMEITVSVGTDGSTTSVATTAAFTPVGTVAATDVQSAIAEVASEATAAIAAVAVNVATVRAATSVTGIRASNTALASLLTALATAGIIVDNTTAT